MSSINKNNLHFLEAFSISVDRLFLYFISDTPKPIISLHMLWCTLPSSHNFFKRTVMYDHWHLSNNSKNNENTCFLCKRYIYFFKWQHQGIRLNLFLLHRTPLIAPLAFKWCVLAVPFYKFNCVDASARLSKEKFFINIFKPKLNIKLWRRHFDVVKLCTS